MGWANCGTDNLGRPIGYAHQGTCDHPGCTTKIDRGLGFACGGMHGEDEVSCDKYFCDEHRRNYVEVGDSTVSVLATGCYHENEDGILVPDA